MSHFAVFFQECPTCGRSLRIPVKYFGRSMTCTHCGGIFDAAGDEPVRRRELPMTVYIERSGIAALDQAANQGLDSSVGPGQHAWE